MQQSIVVFGTLKLEELDRYHIFFVNSETTRCVAPMCFTQPFLLRRIKSEVLTELPARSESVLEVELSPAEAALYEALRQKALRQKALERIAEATAESTSQGKQHLQVLAELTRLRLACCHPSLVGGDSIDSTKLNLFRQKISEIVDDLHNTKRDLADSLLEGSDSSGKLTTEELIGLLKDNQLAATVR